MGNSILDPSLFSSTNLLPSNTHIHTTNWIIPGSEHFEMKSWSGTRVYVEVGGKTTTMTTTKQHKLFVNVIYPNI